MAPWRVTNHCPTSTSQPLPNIEQVLFHAIRATGRKGLRVTETARSARDALRAIEVRTASLGLRPTSEERRQNGCLTVLPLLALFGFGIARVFVGWSRDKPVCFSIGLLVVTTVCIIWVVSRRSYLTVEGERLLGYLEFSGRMP